jgi:hypothetical protein
VADEVHHGGLAFEEVLVLGVGHGPARLFVGPGVDRDDALELRRVDRGPEDRRQIGEKGRVGPDAERQRQHGRQHHCRLAGERTESSRELPQRIAHE